MNSLRHGLRAKRVVLPNEDAAQFQQLCDDLQAEWQPQTPTELALLEKMAICQWKLIRAELYESGICYTYPL